MVAPSPQPGRVGQARGVTGGTFRPLARRDPTHNPRRRSRQSDPADRHAMSQDLDPSATPTPTQPPPGAMPWISTQHEMESSAKTGRTRFVRVRMKAGTHRIASVAYQYSTTGGAADATREHLYRVSLHWLAELDGRDGRAAKISERASANRPQNSLQFRVLETLSADGKRASFARLGPRGQIAAEPPNVGLMSFLRAALVEWVVQEHPDAVVIRGTLSQADAPSEDEKLVRDAFFTKSGFTVVSSADGAGTYQAPSVRSLKTTWNADKVVELTPPMVAEAFAGQLEAALLRKRVAVLEDTVRAVTSERRAADLMARIWLAISLVSFVFGIVMAIQHAG
jgi:hypothetical protein